MEAEQKKTRRRKYLAKIKTTLVNTFSPREKAVPPSPVNKPGNAGTN
jgi:hypothetical protein